MEQQLEQQVTRGLAPQTAPQYSAPKSYPFPTEIISLPSKGLCYPETSPLSKDNKEVELWLKEQPDPTSSFTQFDYEYIKKQ